ncbi:unnamed protein product [Adineta steineri]|uniref:F-box domain-containing protein n=1 Tax=Adineta steineri TaxID=433720 RepID=A0A814LD03_9BILA|nr:unnamed protein product [Adineta steineri]CAF1064460.1 unnamed protein product [Adineta steineri]
MASFICFDELPDLFFIELFHYLSSADILWSFINLNNRIQQIISERGFFRHINLSSLGFYKFDTLLTLLPLSQVQILVINIEASSLQLSRFSYLPHLTTLRLYGLRDLKDAFNFILRHSHSLVYLTLQTHDLFRPRGFGGSVVYPKVHLTTFMENILPHLNALRSLDLGQGIDLGLPLWHVTTIECSLNYLRIPLQHIKQLCQVMSLEKLSTTLEELHVGMRSLDAGAHNDLPDELVLSKMINLHSFSLVQSIFTDNRIEWSTIEILTTANVMPVLRKMNLILFISLDDVDCIKKSALFTDNRQIDIQFAFIMDENSLATQLSEYIPHGSRFHPREIVGITCMASCLTTEDRQMTNLNCYYDNYSWILHVWYTLPWAFDEFFELVAPDMYITKVETFLPSQCNSTMIYPSRLRTLAVSENNSLPSIVSMPHVVQLDRISTVHLSFHDWPIGLKLSSLRHITLTNNLIELKNFALFSSNIRSIQIICYASMPNFILNDWSVFRSLSSLPKLISLQIVINDMDTILDENSCQIIAETAPMFVHFGLCFRRQNAPPSPDDLNRPAEMDSAILALIAEDPTLIINDDDDYTIEPGDIAFLESTINKYQTCIKDIRHRILNLSFHVKPLIVVEDGDCGLTVWF